MRTVGIPVGSPMPAQDDNQQSAIFSSSIESLQQFRSPERTADDRISISERTPPPKLSFTTIQELDPITLCYPFVLPSTWQRACQSCLSLPIINQKNRTSLNSSEFFVSFCTGPIQEFDQTPGHQENSRTFFKRLWTSTECFSLALTLFGEKIQSDALIYDR